MSEWAAHFCGYVDVCVPNCCMAYFCPCISAAQIASRLDYNYWTILFVGAALWILDLIFSFVEVANFSDIPEIYYSSRLLLRGGKLTIWGHLGYSALAVVFIAYWYLRSSVRKQFQIPGSCAGDCYMAFCCSCCSLAQMATHIKANKAGSCDFGPPDGLAAYAD